MLKCPTCGAKLRGKDRCARCKTDLSRLFQILTQADEHYRLALTAYNDLRYEEMYLQAGRSYALKQTTKAGRLKACAALLSGDFDLAITLWKLMGR